MSRLHRINRIHNNLQLLLSFNGQRKIKRAFGGVDGIQNKDSQEVAVKQLYHLFWHLSQMCVQIGDK